MLAMFSCDSLGDGQVGASQGSFEAEPKGAEKASQTEGQNPAAQKPQGEEPKAEEPKAEQPKSEQPKEEPKQADPKSEPQPDPDSQGTEPEKPGQEPAFTEPVDLPKITGKCPDLRRGGPMLFRAKGMNKHRLVQIFVDPKAKGKKGPLIYYWHGTGMNPAEALVGLGPIIQKVTSMGGMVVAPFRDIEAGIFPWFLTADILGIRQDDLLLADEVLACAMQQVGIDTRRIHTLGLSAGALHSTQMSYRRSNYIASSVLYSGGLIVDPPPSKEPRNRFSSMIFHGGPIDAVILPFALTSERFYQELKKNDQFGLLCEHFTGHIIPPGVWDSVWQFFHDHPFGAVSPYKEKIPEGFPIYCKFRKALEKGVLDKLKNQDQEKVKKMAKEFTEKKAEDAG